MKKNYFKLKRDHFSEIRGVIMLFICFISISSINAQSISKNISSSSGSLLVQKPNNQKKTPSTTIAKKTIVNMGKMANVAPTNYVYVGSFNVGDGPCWGDGPSTYSAIEAAALIFGGSSSDYAISVDPSTTDSSTITHTAYLDGYGDDTFINTPTDETFKEGTTYGYPSFSAYVKDHSDGTVYHANCDYTIGITRTNYVWRISQPSITCPGDIVTVIDPNSCGAVVNFSATTTNLTAPVINYSIAPGSLFPIGTTTVTATATGTEGTVSCTFQVTVNSNISIDPVNSLQLCNGENTSAITFNGGNSTANYYWTNDNTAIGLAATGSGNIASFTATNTTNADIVANITVTPTVGAGPMDLITNGGFETNDITGWSIFGYAGTSGCDQGFATYSGNYDPCGLSSTACGGTPLDFTAPEGTYGISTSFDGQGPINKELRQNITIPTNLTTANLQFNDEYYVDLQDFCSGCTGVRVLDVNILDATGTNVLATLYNLTLTPNANYCQAWTPKNIDVLSALQAYSGQNVILSYEITIPESFTGPGWYALDNVHLNINSGCSGAPTSFAITVKATPTAPVVTDQTFCNAATVANLTATGTNIQWYADTTSTISLDPTTALATGTYYVTQTINACESVRTAVNVIVNNTLSPTVLDQTFCNTATVANLTASGSNLQWYDMPTGGTALDATTALSTATYYVSQTLNACEGPRVAVNVTVNTTANPIATDLTFCNAATVGNLTATGTNLQWYTDITGGTPLDPTTALSNGTYYVSQTANACEGPRTAVNVTIVTSSVDTVNDIQLCNGENTAAINFTGSNPSATYAWTNDNAAIGLATSGTGNIASFTATNTTASDITATITVTPTVAAGTMDLVTNGGFETNDLTGWSIFGYAGTSGCDQGFATYSGNYDPCGLSSMACSGAPLNFTPSEGSYGISASFDGQGPINKELRQAITIPANLSLANLQFNDEYYVDLQDFCSGCTGVRVLDVNILDATGTNVLTTLYNLTLTPNANYCQAWTPKNIDVLSALQAYAGQNVILSYEITIPESFTGPGWYALDNVHLNVNNDCSGTPTTFIVTVKPTPSAPIATDQSFCSAATVSNLVATGTNVQWFTSNTGGTALDPSTALTSGTYYASQTINGCESTRTIVNVSVNTTTNPTAADQTFCTSATVSNLIATGNNLQWYSAITGGAALDTTTALSDGTYYVSQTVNNCESTRTPVNVTILTSSVDPIADIQFCNGENTAAINFSGSNSSANYSWTNDNTDIGLAASGNGNIASFIATNTNSTAITATITVTPTVAAGTINLVANGGFETNDLTGWSIFGYAGTSGCDQGFATYSGNYDPCGLSSMACSGTPLDFTAPQGTYGISASFDGQGPINKELRQAINLPVNLSQANLHFNDQYYVDLQDFCSGCTGVRVLDVNVLDATGTNVLATLYNLTLTPNSNYCQTWTPKNLDVLSALQPYAGQNVILSYEITIPEAFTGPGFYALDDVQLNVNSECSGTPTSFVITVKPTPSAPSVTDQTFCNTATVADLSTSGTNTLWYANSTGGTALDPSTVLSSATYYTSQSISSCESPRASSVVTINVTPDVTGNTTQTLADNQTIADIVVTGTNVAWYPSMADALNNTNQIPSNTLVTQGTTYYAVQTINGCTSANPLAVTITVTLGTMSFEGNQIGIFPNPASTILNIKQSNGLIFDRISLFDVTGKLILVQYQNTNQINVENLADGMYLIEAVSENSRFRGKFIKK